MAPAAAPTKGERTRQRIVEAAAPVFNRRGYVGASMRDRIGLIVHSDGSATLRLIDNKTMVPVQLATDAEGGGGLEFIGYDLEASKATIRRLSFDGETEREMSLDGGK